MKDYGKGKQKAKSNSPSSGYADGTTGNDFHKADDQGRSVKMPSGWQRKGGKNGGTTKGKDMGQ